MSIISDHGSYRRQLRSGLRGAVMAITDINKDPVGTAISPVTALEASAIQAASPIVLALTECDEEQRTATITLLAEILFPNADEKGLPGLDLADAEALAPAQNPEVREVLNRMD